MLDGFRSLTTLACCASVEVLPSLTLLIATSVRNLFRDLHAVQGLAFPFAKLSSTLTAKLCDAKYGRCCHSLQQMTFAGKSAGRTELRKHSLFKSLSAGTWPCREWAAFVSCFFFSTLAHTSLLMSGGEISASRFSSSTLIGLKHPVIDLHASFRIKFGSMWRSSSNWACVFIRGVIQRQCCCSNSVCVATPFGV